MRNVQDIIATVRRVEVRTNRLVNDMMVGAYLSRFKGRGLDFEQLREYMPGDDVRYIDWNVTNRMGRPFVKEFREERELSVILVMDISASSACGSGPRSKRDFAVEVGATLAFSAARSSDKVGLLLFTDQVELFLPPQKGRRHIMRVLREMLFFEPRHNGTQIRAALAFLNHVLLRRSILFLMTDFLHCFDGDDTGQVVSALRDPLGAEAGATNSPGSAMAGRELLQVIGSTNARHDLVCVHLHDPRESHLPEAGLLTLEDAETGELLEVDSTQASVRQSYDVTNEERIRSLDASLRQTGAHTLRLNAHEPFAQKLQTFFETRRRR